MLAFSNAKVFDGVNNRLTQANVVVDGQRIVSVSDKPVDADVEVIDCGGRTLMPGLIDAHNHA